LVETSHAVREVLELLGLTSLFVDRVASNARGRP
jgi:hypothetical protein